MTPSFRHILVPGLVALGTLWAAAASAQEACSGAPIGEAPFDCLCAGGIPAETIWGSNPYTGDSGLCAAAFHAGAIGEEGGLVSVIPGPGLDSFEGSTGNGITSRSWGAYGTSFQIETRAFDAFAATTEVCSAYPSGLPSYTCSCPPYDDTGAVWGSGPYTADSSICVAAIHAGVLSPDGGEVTALAVGGLEAYRGSDANGVVSRDWGSYGASFVFDANR